MDMKSSKPSSKSSHKKALNQLNDNRLGRVMGGKLTLISTSIVLASGLMACGSDNNNDNNDNDASIVDELVLSEASYLKANNGTDNAGTVDTINEYSDLLKQITTGANEGVELDTSGNLVQAADITDSSLRFVCAINRRMDGANYDSNRDREIIGSSTGLLNPKGIAFAHSAGLVLVANFNASQISVYGSAAAGDAEPVAISSLSAKPWDLAYDEPNDRLFVALTDGTVGVYDSYISDGFIDTPTRIIIPVDDAGTVISTNIHGIVYDGDSDRLVVSDVGDADVATDGAIFVIDNATSVTGNVMVSRQIGGPNSMLGNPVDIVLNGTELRIAEKSNDAILIYANIFSGDSGDIEPDLITSSVKPESLVQIPTMMAYSDASETTDSSTVSGIIASSNPPAGEPTSGQIMAFDTELADSMSVFTTGLTTESVSLDHAGDLYATFDSDHGGGVFIANRGATVRAQASSDMARDRAIMGDATGLVSPKGLDIDSANGLVFVAENDSSAPGIRVFSACANGNASPLLTLGNSLDVSPWDVDYDASTDTAFVALTNGTVAVYENVVANLSGDTIEVTSEDRLITPTVGGAIITAPTNLHGIDYDPVSDSLLVSDIGDAASATDGKLYVLPNAGMADGMLDVSVLVAGHATMLGNPVDIMFDGSSVYVAEKSNSKILKFDNILSSSGGNLSPDAAVDVVSAESVAIKSDHLN